MTILNGRVCPKVCHFPRLGAELNAAASTALEPGRRQNGRVANEVCRVVSVVPRNANAHRQAPETAVNGEGKAPIRWSYVCADERASYGTNSNAT